jgi:DNA replication protein DnaC
MSAPAAPLAPDLEQALKRLKLRAVRQLAPEVLQTAKVQRWAPEELLRTLVEAEIAARDQANERAPLRVAAFPVRKTLDEFKVQESAVPQPTFAYLASLEWIRGEVAPRTALIRDQLRQRPVACSRPPLQRRSA